MRSRLIYAPPLAEACGIRPHPAEAFRSSNAPLFVEKARLSAGNKPF